MTKSKVITYKVYWKNDPNPLIVKGKSLTTALRLAGYNPDKVQNNIDYYTSSDVTDEENSNVP